VFTSNISADPENEAAIKGFEGAKKWATENNIKEVLAQISIYEKALKDVEDDDEAVQEKFNSVVANFSFSSSSLSFSFSFSAKTFSSSVKKSLSFSGKSSPELLKLRLIK
jgi:hypothetical protein